ncbi:MAG: N-acetylmuramoyl-L-alanine amidase [Rhodobacter sp.]|nr:N-acetylmuramoyl-L-alanine amidase [Rhodobacter sp.]
MSRVIDEIIVHCLATHNGWMAGSSVDAKVAEVRRWHIEERGWRDIGYAVVIDRDGSIGWGRNIDDDDDYFDDVGAHTRGRNSRSVGVALVGGATSAATDAFLDNFTPAQDKALRQVIAQIKNYARKELPVNGHNQYANKACPGFHAPSWYAQEVPRSIVGSNTLRSAATGAAATAGAIGTTVTQLEGDSQRLVIILGFIALLAFAFIFRERIKMWARGIR